MRKIKIKKISETYDKLAAPNPNAKLRPSIGMDQSIGEFFYLDVENLKTYEKQARKHFDEEELNLLAETIREHGVRQPLSVIKTEEPGVYQVISGERRLRASKIAGLEKVPCIILPDATLAEEIAVIENIQRSDLHPIELANAYFSLLQNFNHGDQVKLAKKLGVSKSHISEILSLSKLTEEIKNFLIENNIRARSTLRKVVALEDSQRIKEFLGIQKKKSINNSKRKFIYSFYIKNGEVAFQMNTFRLTDIQKSKLREQLQQVIQSLAD